MTLQRIVYVVNVFPKLSETFIAGELAELGRRGVEVRVLSLRQPQESLRHEIVTRARLVERTVYEHGEFRSVLHSFQPELLHAHFATEPTAAVRELAGEFGLPFTFTAHGYDLHRKPPADLSERAAAAAAVITVCYANAQHLTHAFGVPAGHIRVIPCGVDLERFRPEGCAADPPHIVCVARLVPVKNLEMLLFACHQLQSRGLRFRCVIVGEGPCREQLEATRARLALDDVVQLVGAAEQAEVLAWWQKAAVAVLTSEREGMPVSLLEAAACGLPAVATAVGGIPELVEDGVTGRLVPPADPLIFASALEQLLRNPSLAAKLGRAARQRVKERFSLRRQVDQLLDIWAGLVRGRASACAAYR
jgi:glycosyltransferase involved in cell wall biosynthesis